jgi:hypothetical protein
MANCRYCGKPAGFCCPEHEICRKANEAGVSLEELAAKPPVRVPGPPVTAQGVFFAVFFALCAWSLVMSVVLAFIRDFILIPAAINSGQ